MYEISKTNGVDMLTWHIKPENCTPEYAVMTVESEYQALLTESLSFELNQ